MTSTREEYGVRKPPGLKVASESYREEMCGLLAFTTPAAANPSMKVPPFANVVQVALTCKNSAPRSVASRSALGGES
jgi:hypothetical protein